MVLVALVVKHALHVRTARRITDWRRPVSEIRCVPQVRRASLRRNSLLGRIEFRRNGWIHPIDDAVVHANPALQISEPGNPGPPVDGVTLYYDIEGSARGACTDSLVRKSCN